MKKIVNNTILKNYHNDYDEFYMAMAINLARKGIYTTNPNPRVGCIIVKNNKIIAEGWHVYAGEHHAEINALNKAKFKAEETTVFVNMEPCSHHGLTGACAIALIKAKIARLVVAMLDPNPTISGKGIEILHKYGIDVKIGICESDARILNIGFISRMTCNRPYVRLKMAMSLDGRTAMSDGKSQWITGIQSRCEVHKLRARSSAGIIGIKSLLQDDSRLTVRKNESCLITKQICKQPIRVIIDSNLRTNYNARIISELGITLIITRNNIKTRNIIEKSGAKVFIQKIKKNKCANIDIIKMLEYLAYEEYCNEVLFETGSTLAGALLKDKIIDELIIFIAPILIGTLALPLFNINIFKFTEQYKIRIDNISAVGKDLRIIAYPLW